MGNIKDVQLDSDQVVNTGSVEEAIQKAQVSENSELLKKIDIQKIFNKIKEKETEVANKTVLAVQKPIVIKPKKAAVKKMAVAISPEKKQMLTQAVHVLKPEKY